MWYEYRQNNSGGSFVHQPKAGIGCIVIIEEVSADAANERAKDIGLYFDGCETGDDCECCGDRWYRVHHLDGHPVPSHYGEPLNGPRVMNWGEGAYIHPLNEGFYEYNSKD